ncbi:colorectal mutant cancer protein-like isoform X2 [Styela clava]
MNPVSKRKPWFLSHDHINHSDKNVLDVQELLYKKEEELNKTRATLDGIREERDHLRRKVHNLLNELNQLKGTKRDDGRNNGQGTASPSGIAVSKKAKRVKLKKTPVKNSNVTEDIVGKFHGKDLDSEKLSSRFTEQLVQDFRTSSNIQEILNDSTNPSIQSKFEIELKRLSCCNDHLKSENNLLRLTLQESKNKTEQLQMLLSKFESNNTVQKMTLFYSELTSEAYLALISCLEKVVLEQEFLEDTFHHIKHTHKYRLRRTLNGLQHSLNDDFSPSDVSSHLPDFLDQIMESCSLYEVTASDFLTMMELCKEVEKKKQAVKRAIVDLDSFSIGTLQSPSYSNKSDKVVSEFDLENAVLLHELTSVKEELVNLKCEYQKANQSLHESSLDLKPKSIKSRTSSAASYNCVWTDSAKSMNEAEADAEMNKKPAFLSLADLRISTMAESELGTELSEALKREQRLKKENDRLAFSLQQIQQNSENRHIKSSQVMSSLKDSYSKKEKLKHRTRVQELEKVLAISDAKHLIQIQELKRKVLFYERERENTVLPENETAL